MNTENKLQFNKSSTHSNYLLKTDWGYISYNNTLAKNGFFASDNGEEETALCHEDKFYILNGDWRKEYILALEQNNDFEYALYSVFLPNQKSNISTWSDKYGEEKSIEDIKEWLSKREL